MRSSYLKQLNHIAITLKENFNDLDIFFTSLDYELKYEEIRQFIINKCPNLFKSDNI